MSKENEEMICRCKGITKGEILKSVSEYQGEITIEEVKKITGAGSGKCKGGYCNSKIVEILNKN